MKTIGEILHVLPENFTQENIHELRLEIKRIKALFTLLCYTNRDFPIRKYYRPFKTIFEKAGAIRIIQVEQELLKKYISDSSDCYLDQLQKLKHEKSKALEEMVKSNRITKLKSIKRKIIPFLNKVSEKNVKHFLKTNARKLIELVERKVFKEQNLHIIRKKLKSFYFIAKATFTDVTIPQPWSRLLELLGEWHDAQVAIEHLRKAIYSSHFSQGEVNRLYKVKREIAENRENSFDQIVATYYLIESKEGAISVPDNSMITQIQ